MFWSADHRHAHAGNAPNTGGKLVTISDGEPLVGKTRMAVKRADF